MIVEAGFLLASHDDKTDPGLWFVIYSDEEGAVAIDLTREHPHSGYKGFESVLNFEDLKPETEKVVLLGGPERPEDTLVILHETAASNADSHFLNHDFSFLSYTYILSPGKPPALTRTDNRPPSRISLKKPSHFLIAMGYRIFDGPVLAQEIRDGRWVCLPATVDIVFNTGRRERRSKLINKMN